MVQDSLKWIIEKQAILIKNPLINVANVDIYILKQKVVRGAYNILVGRLEERRPLGRPRRRWEDNSKMDLREIGFEDVDWIHLAQDRDRWRAPVNTVMNLRVP
jgi:hypothetical protein